MNDRVCSICGDEIPETEVLHASLRDEEPICDICAEEYGCSCMCYDVDEQYIRKEHYYWTEPEIEFDGFCETTTRYKMTYHKTVKKSARDRYL